MILWTEPAVNDLEAIRNYIEREIQNFMLPASLRKYFSPLIS